MATLIPIVFGILAILAKKAIFISKAALVISSSLALGSILFNSYGNWGSYGHAPHGSHGGHYGFNPGFGYKITDELGHGLGEYSQDINYRGFNNEYPQDQIKFRQEEYNNVKVSQKGRNFAWNDAEKETKS